MKSARPVLAAILLLAAPAHAPAHGLDAEALTRLGPFGAGLAHPVLGPDHFLAMASVGLLSAVLAGAHFWRVPLTFVATMPVGWALGRAGMPFPPVEIGIAVSVVALGTGILLARRLPVWSVYAAVACFALFHGYAHGGEQPPGSSALPFAAGFTTATLSIHALGLGIGDLAGAERPGGRITPVLAGLIALAGLYYLTGALSA